jgi:hypothetical protein
MINSQGLMKGKGMARGPSGSEIWDDAASLAIAALGFLAADEERLGRFLALTGLGPESLRSAAGQPDFLAGVLTHLMEDEPLLLAFAAEAGQRPERVARAQAVLAGPPGDTGAL